MKKKIILFISVLFLSISSLFAAPLKGIENGDYCYYLDFRGEMNFYRGYLFLQDTDSTYILCRSVNLDTNEQSVVMFNIVEKKQRINIGTMKGDYDPSKPDFAQGVIDAMNFTEAYLKNQKKMSYDTQYEDPWDGFSLVYHFNKVLPGFKFTEITKMGNDEHFYILNRMGRCRTDDQVKEFLTMQPISFNGYQRDIDLSIPQAEPMEVELNGIKIPLDTNWQETEYEGNKAYWLPLNSERDSQIMVEDAKNSGFNLKSEKEMSQFVATILTIIQNIDPTSIYVEYYEKSMNLSYVVIDEEQLATITLISINNNKIYNFSSYVDIYAANQEYYNNIIKNSY